MIQHVNWHYSEKLKSPLPERKKLFKGPTRAKEITRCISVFMAKDMRLFSVVENEGFQLLVNTLEPKYCIPSHLHFSQAGMPALYQETKAKVVQVLREADSVSITTDDRNSRTTQSYITITVHANRELSVALHP